MLRFNASHKRAHQSRILCGLCCPWLVVFLLCGCSTVQPELTPEERVYNQQLKQQAGSHGLTAMDDLNTGQKIVYYTLLPVSIVLYGLGQSGAHFPFDHDPDESSARNELTAAVLELPVSERLRLIEEIWNSI